MNPVNKLKRRFSAAVDWRVDARIHGGPLSQLERRLDRLEATLAEVMASANELRSALASTSAGLTDQHRQLGTVVEQLERRVAEIGTLVRGTMRE